MKFIYGQKLMRQRDMLKACYSCNFIFGVILLFHLTCHTSYFAKSCNISSSTEAIGMKLHTWIKLGGTKSYA